MAAKNCWVVCDEYAAGPYAQDRAEREVEAIAKLAAEHRLGCRLEHRIVVSATNPVPAWRQALEAAQP